MEAIGRFVSRYRDQLEKPSLKAIKSSYKIPNPQKSGSGSPLAVTVQTLPEVTEELAAETDEALGDAVGPTGLINYPVLRDDYVPEGAMIILTQFQQRVLNVLSLDPNVTVQTKERQNALNGAPADTPDLPVVLIQTSRPKAKALIQQLQQAQGVQAVCFNPGSDPFSGEAFELGLLQTGDGELHLFAEYETNGSTDRHLLERWNQWQRDCNGACAVLIAGGITGSSKGKPGVKDILGIFEARCKTSKELHLPPLMLQYATEWELE
ncbi:MAG: hypothetical protein WBA99_05880 [Nodosilinea sp.]